MSEQSVVTQSTTERLVAEADEHASYIRTESAKSLIGAFDSAGLKLSWEAEAELTRERDKRYGNAYAWMSRELAKGISGREQALLELPEEVWSDEKQDYIQPQLDVTDLEYTGEQGSDVLIAIIKNMHERHLDEQGLPISELPVSTENGGVKTYGCKDVESYFMQARSMPDKLSTVDVNGKKFWHKTHGGPTYLSLQSVVYNGVELPPGSVFRQTEDGGYMFLRLTGFTFDLDKAEECFGASITDAYEIDGWRAAMQATFEDFAKDREAAQAIAS